MREERKKPSINNKGRKDETEEGIKGRGREKRARVQERIGRGGGMEGVEE